MSLYHFLSFGCAVLLLGTSVNSLSCFQGQETTVGDQVIESTLIAADCITDDLICQRLDIIAILQGVQGKVLVSMLLYRSVN